MNRSDPVLHVLPIDEIRPTQMTLGLLEVVEKRKAWRAAKNKDRTKLLTEHVAPGVIGPKGWFYVVDHHHLIRALHEEAAPGVFVQILADFSKLDVEEFWTNLDHRQWAHPYDEAGRRTDFADMPKHIADLKDDPYRSLAGVVRRAGGFAKDLTPYVEFLWATFFRLRIDHDDLIGEFEDSVAHAVKLAHSGAAAHLPGWCGVKD